MIFEFRQAYGEHYTVTYDRYILYEYMYIYVYIYIYIYLGVHIHMAGNYFIRTQDLKN
jgi:hypothetical protein